MRGIRFAAGMMAAGLMACTAAARAQDADTVRLDRTDEAATKNLLDDGSGADTIAAWRGGFRAGGFVRGGFGGFRAGGFVRGGFRGWGGWGWRGWGWRGWGYRPWGWGWGWGYRPWVGVGFGGFYPYYGVAAGVYAPCAYVPSSVSVTTLDLPLVGYSVYPGLETSPAVPATPGTPPSAEPTYPYDGGPTNPVPTPRPMPRADQPPAAPSAAPTPSVPLEGRAVSLPRSGSKWTFPAYGEQPRRTSDSRDRSLGIRK
jgi:hypothetical protein